MRRLLLIAAGLLLCCGVVFAQPDATADVSVWVVSSIAVSTDQDLNFGTIVLGTPSKTVASDDLTNAARFLIEATSGVDVEIQLAPPSVLTNGSDDVAFANDQDPFTSPNSDGTAGSFMAGGAAANGGLVQTVGNALYLWVGGTVNLNGSENPGLYTGEYTVTATYTGL
jgi:hypothetical protein